MCTRMHGTNGNYGLQVLETMLDISRISTGIDNNGEVEAYGESTGVVYSLCRSFDSLHSHCGNI